VSQEKFNSGILTVAEQIVTRLTACGFDHSLHSRQPLEEALTVGWMAGNLNGQARLHRIPTLSVADIRREKRIEDSLIERVAEPVNGTVEPYKSRKT